MNSIHNPSVTFGRIIRERGIYVEGEIFTQIRHHHLLRHFTERKKPIQFTRSRAYHKDDNAYVEFDKNLFFDGKSIKKEKSRVKEKNGEEGLGRKPWEL